MKVPIVMWFFEELDKRGRWKRLSWRMTDEDAQRHMDRNGIELPKLEHTAETRADLYGTGYGQRVSPTAAGRMSPSCKLIFNLDLSLH